MACQAVIDAITDIALAADDTIEQEVPDHDVNARVRAVVCTVQNPVGICNLQNLSPVDMVLFSPTAIFCGHSCKSQGPNSPAFMRR